MFFHVVRQFFADSVHNDVQSATGFAQFYDCSLDINVATVGLGAVIGTSDDITFAVDLDRTGVMSPETVDVKVGILILVVFGQLVELGIDITLGPTHDSCSIATENQKMITLDWTKTGSTSCCDRRRCCFCRNSC